MFYSCISFQFNCSYQSDVNSCSLAGIREICLTCVYYFHIYVLPCACFDILLPRIALCRGSLVFIFPLCVLILYSFSNHFVCFPTNNYELNLDSTLNITEVCLPIYSKPPCANMCEYNQHAEQSSDDFVSLLRARYIAINDQVISLYLRVLFFSSPTKHTCFIGCKLEGA